MIREIRDRGMNITEHTIVRLSGSLDLFGGVRKQIIFDTLCAYSQSLH